MKDEIWVTKNGQKVAVSDMTEKHAKNALRMLIRRVNGADEEAPVDMEDMVVNGCDRYGSLDVGD